MAPRPSSRGQFWNRIPDAQRERVVEIALEKPEMSARQLAWHITDNESWSISERRVYRILRAHDLLTSPAYIVISAADEFKHKTSRVHEMWQTDFTYFKVIGWGWFYLSTILDDYSRYIGSWKLRTSMSADDVKAALDDALAKTGIEKVRVRHRPRLLSDNGPCYISKELGAYLEEKEMTRTRGTLSSPDSGQDRAVSPDDEERGEAPELLPVRGLGTGDRPVRGIL